MGRSAQDLERHARRSLGIVDEIVDAYCWLFEGDEPARQRLVATRAKFHAAARKLWQCADLRELRGGGPGETSRDFVYSLNRVEGYANETAAILRRTDLRGLVEGALEDVEDALRELFTLAVMVQPATRLRPPREEQTSW